MRFQSKSSNFTRVVIPRRQVFLPNGEKGNVTDGLEARFKNHFFDSIQAQRDKGWTDEQRVSVEVSLQNMPGFGTAGTGVYLDADQEGGAPSTPEPSEASIASSSVRCIYTINTAEGTEQCSREARPNGDYCNQHYAVVAKKEEEVA